MWLGGPFSTDGNLQRPCNPYSGPTLGCLGSRRPNPLRLYSTETVLLSIFQISFGTQIAVTSNLDSAIYQSVILYKLSSFSPPVFSSLEWDN